MASTWREQIRFLQPQSRSRSTTSNQVIWLRLGESKWAFFELNPGRYPQPQFRSYDFYLERASEVCSTSIQVKIHDLNPSHMTSTWREQVRFVQPQSGSRSTTSIQVIWLRHGESMWGLFDLNPDRNQRPQSRSYKFDLEGTTEIFSTSMHVENFWRNLRKLQKKCENYLRIHIRYRKSRVPCPPDPHQGSHYQTWCLTNFIIVRTLHKGRYKMCRSLHT